MRKLTLTLLTILILAISSNGQTFIDQIRIGQKMPEKINKGGFTEEKTDNCTCRIFSINYNINQQSLSGGAVLAETIGIHYNEYDTVTGIIEINLRLNNEDAQKVYNSRLIEYMRTQLTFKDRQLIKVRDSDNGIVDGIYYFIYSYDSGKKYRATGVIENAIIDETYLPKSNYQPRLATPRSGKVIENPMPNYSNYFNERFKFCSIYPADYLYPQGESANGDGQTFLSKDGESLMLVSAMFSIGETIAESFASATQGGYYYNREKIITYKVLKDNWFVVLGKTKGKVFYIKRILDNDSFKTIYFEYPNSELSIFDVIISHVTKQFPKCN